MGQSTSKLSSSAANRPQTPMVVRAPARNPAAESLNARIQKVAKPNTLAALPPDIFLIVVGMLEIDDIPAICRMGTVAYKLLGMQPGPSALNRQIADCQRITSVAKLKAQAAGLNRYFPEILPRRMKNVIQSLLPQLRTIDFSANAVEGSDLKEFFNAFSAIEIPARAYSPNQVKVKEVIVNGRTYILFIPSRNQDDDIVFEQLAEKSEAPIFPLNDGETQNKFNRTYLSAAGKYTFFNDADENCLSILRRLCPGTIFSLSEQKYARLGNIEHVDFGDLNLMPIFRELFGFLRSFCPRLSHFKAEASDNDEANLYLIKYLTSSTLQVFMGRSRLREPLRRNFISQDRLEYAFLRNKITSKGALSARGAHKNLQSRDKSI